MAINKTSLCLLMCFMAAAAPLAIAQVPQIQNLVVNDTVFPVVRATFDLRLASGEFADTLGSDNISIMENGAKVRGKLSRWSQDRGMAVVIVVDTSGSMKALLPQMIKALTEFVGQLGPRDKAALMTFDQDFKTVSPFTSDAERLRGELSNLSAAGKTTELFYAVYNGAKLMREGGLPERKALVVISDGRNEGTAYTLDDCIREANENRVDVIGVGIATGSPSALLNIRRLAEMTEGVYLTGGPKDNWTDKMGFVRKQLNARWEFEWNSVLAGDGRDHKDQLQVSFDGLTVAKDISVHSPVIVPPKAWWVEWLPWMGLSVVIVAIAATILLFRWSRVKRELLKKQMNAKLDEERKRLEKEEKDKREASQSGQGMPDASAKANGNGRIEADSSKKSFKRKTVFYSGDQAIQPELISYQNAFLHVIEGPSAGASLQLSDIRTTIGREDDNHIVIEEARVSKYHAAIINENGSYFLEDLGSSNGTFVDDGIKISSRLPLRNGQIIRLGGVSMRFIGEE